MQMSKSAPSQKVTAGFLAATGMAILLIVLNQYVIPANPLPEYLLTLIPSWFGSLVSYLVSPSEADVATVGSGSI